MNTAPSTASQLATTARRVQRRAAHIQPPPARMGDHAGFILARRPAG
jgi:hypothetical protein